MASGWCWGSLNVVADLPESLRDVCIGIWAISGVLLALSQIVFIGIALTMRDGGAPMTNDATGTSQDASRPNASKIVILVSGALILIAVALFVFALATMPS